MSVNAPSRQQYLFPSLLLIALLISAISIKTSHRDVPPVSTEDGGFIPVTDAILLAPADADWLMWRRTLNGWGYSPLDQINRQNVARLEPAWSLPLNEGIQEGTPLVYQGVMYMPHPGDVIQALDAGTGEVLWHYQRPMPDDLADYITAINTNRALAIYQDAILYTSNDGYLVAIDIHTGKERWATMITDYKVNPTQQSSGPIIIEGRAISGRGCQPIGGPESCVITAHDATTGTELWRLNTIERPGENAVDSWGGMPWDERWHVGAWMMPSYDPEVGLIYMGTSVTAPAPKFLMAGPEHEYLYHNSTLAIDPVSGSIVWHYQHLVDHWDLDHPFERLVLDTEVAPDPGSVPWINPDIEPGRVYRVLTGIPGKTGLVYTLDRETGEFLWARPTVHQTVVADIDGRSGKVRVNPEMIFDHTGQEIELCPSHAGGRNWWAGAYSPRSGLMYQGLQNTCTGMSVTLDQPDREALYGIFGREKVAAADGMAGSLFAISARTGVTAWEHRQSTSFLSVVATGGGLVFGGDIAGNFRAFDDDSGQVLWEVALGSAVTGYPITYEAGGRQYVVASTGSSVTTNTQARLFPELQMGRENRLHVFALPE